MPEATIDRIVPHTATGQDLSIIAARVSYTLGLLGPSLALNTACSSSLVAVHLARQSLQRGESRVALAGGVNLMISPESTVAMSKFGAMAPDGRSKAFDARANGYVRGEGGGVVVLKRLSDAVADGDRVYCVIRGSAVNNDGFSNGLTAPRLTAGRVDIALATEDRAVEVPLVILGVDGKSLGALIADLGGAIAASRAREALLLRRAWLAPWGFLRRWLLRSWYGCATVPPGPQPTSTMRDPSRTRAARHTLWVIASAAARNPSSESSPASNELK